MPTRMKLTDVDLLTILETNQLMSKFKLRSFKKKQIISSPAQEDNFVFLIKTGRVRVYLTYEDKEFTLAVLEAGDIYSSHTRACTQALQDSTLMVTDIKNFNEIISDLPDFALTMVKVLGDLLKNSFTIIDGLVFKEAHLRLVEFLDNVAEEKGIEDDRGIRLELGLNIEEIAMLLGTTRQTVSTLLNGFQRTGLLEKTGRGTIIIKDRERLKQLISE